MMLSFQLMLEYVWPCRSRQGGNPAFTLGWIPAFAGMTIYFPILNFIASQVVKKRDERRSGKAETGKIAELT
jgi:hypothetical protein